MQMKDIIRLRYMLASRLIQEERYEQAMQLIEKCHSMMGWISGS